LVPPWTIDEINRMSEEEFVSNLGFLFESSPWIVRAVWPERPFRNREDLHVRLGAVIRSADAERQLALIRAHPDLVGRAALSGTLTRESTGEQRSAGLDPNELTPDEIERFAGFNARYKARFDFPFVICARENKQASILAGFRNRLGNSVDAEIATAIGEIEKIGWYRLADVVREGERSG
jgi:OHCU decarboxylase